MQNNLESKYQAFVAPTYFTLHVGILKSSDVIYFRYPCKVVVSIRKFKKSTDVRVYCGIGVDAGDTNNLTFSKWFDVEKYDFEYLSEPLDHPNALLPEVKDLD